jgi:siroheme synthase (precorrin-2 oxidase/ferrochelatase)
MELVRTFWPVFIGSVLFLIWLIRLESRSIENGKEIRRLWNQRKEDMEMSRQSREDTNKMLAEIRDDIKELIGKVGK